MNFLTIKHFLSCYLKPSKWVILNYFQNMGRNCHFVTHFDLPKELRRKCLILTNFFPTNKHYLYLKIELMQNETNLWSSFFGKDELLVKL